MSALVTLQDRAWAALCELNELPRPGARVYRSAGWDIAVFRTSDDRVFALADRCPHKGGPLSQGLVCGHAVTCPLHGWVIQLDTGEACAPDTGSAARYAVKVEDGRVWLRPGAPAPEAGS